MNSVNALSFANRNTQLSMHSEQPWWALGLACLTLLLTSGCSVWNNSKKSDSWSPSQWFKKEYQEPTSMAAIWSPDTLAQAGQPTMRGFGGRIYFYNERSQAVPIEGDLVIHGYLTTPGSNSGEVKSDQRFVFTSEQLTTHFSPSQIGASYSIWVPWDQEGGFRQEVTLIPTFKSKQGTVVQGTPAKVFLPGKSRFPDDPALEAGMTTRTVSYVSESIPTNPVQSSSGQRSTGLMGFGQIDMGQSAATPSGTRTTTIQIPDSAGLSRSQTQRSSFDLPDTVSVGQAQGSFQLQSLSAPAMSR